MIEEAFGRLSGARMTLSPQRAAAAFDPQETFVSLVTALTFEHQLVADKVNLSATPSSGAVRFLLWFVDHSQSFWRRSGTIEQRFSDSFWVAQR